MPTVSAVLERLASLASPGGGWGYQVGQPAHLEPTCFALLALAGDREKYGSLIENGLRVLEANRNPDGSYRLIRGRPQAVWPTAVVLFTEQALGRTSPAHTATVDCLLAQESRVVKLDGEVSDMKMDIDLTLRGWPWADANFAWVEPTCWACLALRAAGRGNHPRVQEGMKLILDRAFESGGVNYGNRMVLGKSTEPMPGPTAMMLVALQGLSDQPRIDAAVGYLRLLAARTTDLEYLAWAKLALSLHTFDSATRDLLPELDSRIDGALSEEMHRTDGLGAGPYRLALAALALDTGHRHPFRLPDSRGIAAGESPSGEDRTANRAGERRPLLDKVKSKFRGWMVNGINRLRPLPVNSVVHIARVESYDEPLLEVLQKQFEKYRQLVPMQGKRVVLKPNLVEYRQGKPVNTDPRVIDAVISLCKAEGAAEIIVAEGPGHYRNAQFLVKESGLGQVLEKHGVRFVDVNHDEPVKMLNLGRLTGLEYLYLSRTVAEAEVLISLPKLKTHHWAGATLSLKNLFGTLPGICYGWPKNELHWRGIPQSVIDIALTLTPHLAIVDGIVGMEGDGPLAGTAKHVGALVMGLDLLAVDATCCRLMKLPPERVPILALGAHKRLGRLKESEIPQLGESIESMATEFEMAPHVDQCLLPAEEVKA